MRHRYSTIWLPKRKDFVDENHGHILTGDRRIMKSSKFQKPVSKVPIFVKQCQ